MKTTLETAIKKYITRNALSILIPFFTALSFAALFRFYLYLNSHADLRTLIISIFFGTQFDVVVALYLSAPFLGFVLFFGKSQKRFFKTILGYMYGSLCFFLLFTHIGEFFFYKEFFDRLNFIAVDYLIYTQEVLKNIWESYHVTPILISIAIASAGLATVYMSLIKKPIRHNLDLSKRVRSAIFGIYILVAISLNIAVKESVIISKFDAQIELLSKNGLHTFFAAFRNNEIDFDRFYSLMPAKTAAWLVHETLEEGYEKDIKEDVERENSIVQNIVETKSPKKLNVVLVLMESMSARFMKTYGNHQGLTPNLDRLAKESLFFSKVYSTGTRTVRGIEATMLSLPPTPGQSIVRRPGGQGIFNIGTVFKEFGYSNTFIYGGHSVFDNMKTFFSSNGFNVVDLANFSDSEISFSNAWGVCDEDLFKKAIREADASSIKNQPFFQFILTTSNHRPYSYPEGRIDIPPKTGRDGAVKYSDYAIGEFINQAKSKAWFAETVFIFVSDHNAAVAGATRIDPKDYRIPLIFYNLPQEGARKVSTLGSQIDLAPTLFDLLNFSYQSRFMGHSLVKPQSGRTFLSTYQDVAYMTSKKLIVFSPRRRIQEYAVPGLAKTADLVVAQLKVSKQKESKYPADWLEGLAYYKTASDWFKKHLFSEKRHFLNSINKRDL